VHFCDFGVRRAPTGNAFWQVVAWELSEPGRPWRAASPETPPARRQRWTRRAPDSASSEPQGCT